jgi:hypothetical protein
MTLLSRLFEWEGWMLLIGCRIMGSVSKVYRIMQVMLLYLISHGV